MAYLAVGTASSSHLHLNLVNGRRVGGPIPSNPGPPHLFALGRAKVLLMQMHRPRHEARFASSPGGERGEWSGILRGRGVWLRLRRHLIHNPLRSARASILHVHQQRGRQSERIFNVGSAHSQRCHHIPGSGIRNET